MTYLRQRNYDIETGREEGREEGRLQQAMKIAENMLNKNYPIDDIAEITGLPLEKIQELASQITQEA